MIPRLCEVITDIRESELSDYKANLIALFSIWELCTPTTPSFHSTVTKGAHSDDTEPKLCLKLLTIRIVLWSLFSCWY